MAEAEDPEVTSFHGHTEITATSVQLKLTKQKTKKNPKPRKDWQNRTCTVNLRADTKQKEKDFHPTPDTLRHGACTEKTSPSNT